MDKKEIDFRRKMAELGFYSLHLMETSVLCTFRNYQTDGTILSNTGIMLYFEQEEIEIEKEWLGTYICVDLKKIKKAFELIKEFYSEK